MDPEHRLMNEVCIWCGSNGYLSFRTNAGTFLSADGSHYVKGLPQGFPDLLILRPDGKACFVETKIHPRKATPEQERFIALVKSMGYRAGVAYTVDDARKIIEDDIK